MSLSLSSARFHLSRVSSNKKTGPIPVTTTSRNSCPPTCAMRPACYAMTGPLALHWDKVSNGERGKTWRDHLADLATLPLFSPLRLNQPEISALNGRLSRRYLVQLIWAVRLRKRKLDLYPSRSDQGEPAVAPCLSQWPHCKHQHGNGTGC